MIIRRSIVTGCALALVLTACAGASDGTVEPDEPVAAAESTPEVDDPATEESATDDAATGTDDADAAAHDGSEDAHDGSDETDEEPDETDEEPDETGDDHEDKDAAAAEDVDRVVEIDMEDIEFSVEELQFSVGERVLFTFENVGAAPHEALIGDMHLQDEHEEQMAAGDGHHDGEGHHGDLSMISLEPGESGSFVHEFTEAGELWMGCHVPGHWGAGMQTRIVVTG